MGNQFELITAFTPEECASRLAAAIDYELHDLSRLRLGGGSKPVLGEVNGNTFLLRKRITTMGHNSFGTYAVGTLQATEAGTVVSGRFSAHPGFRLGYRAWGCCAVFIGAPIFIHLLYALGSGAILLIGLWDSSYQAETMGLLVLTCFPLLFAIGRASAAGDDDFLWDFLKQALEARTG